MTKTPEVEHAAEFNASLVCKDLVAALQTALAYVERIAATQPFESSRQRRQQQAVKDVELIRAALAHAGAA